MHEDRELQFVRGSDNVYADLGLPKPEESRLKASLMRSINEGISARRWCVQCAAAQLGLSQDEMRNITDGRISAFSVESLHRILNRVRQAQR